MWLHFPSSKGRRATCNDASCLSVESFHKKPVSRTQEERVVNARQQVDRNGTCKDLSNTIILLKTRQESSCRQPQ
eukprot:5701434-Amphidinium_carterae.1